MYFEQIVTPGLGCFSYMFGCPMAGVMAVVDPKRDIDIYVNRSRELGMKITHIFDTHIHADHISGGRELAHATGATICLHESASVAYDVQKTAHNDTFDFGPAHVRILHTPGHTPESMSLLITDKARSTEPQMLLTGDLLFVGDTGRPDLPGKAILDTQVRTLFDSLQNVLGEFADGVIVYPGHGQGSLCGGGISTMPHTTLGFERLANPRMVIKDYDTFYKNIMSYFPMRPQSFSHIIATNMAGAPLLPPCETHLPSLSPQEVKIQQELGAVILDLRASLSFAAAHIKGSLHVDISQRTAPNWIGTVVKPQSRIILVLNHDFDFAEQRTMLRRMGYDDVVGWLYGGMNAWIDTGLPTQSLNVISAKELSEKLASSKAPLIIDVRTPQEISTVPFLHAKVLSFDDILASDACPILEDEAIVLCQSGYRASIAAALLQARGCHNIGFIMGGIGAYKQVMTSA